MIFYELAEQIDGLLKGKVTKRKADKLFALIESNIECQKYFFMRVSNINWFYHLKAKAYFVAKSNPSPITNETTGFVTVPEWQVLPYLEHVSRQVNILRNKNYTDELLAVIRETSNYKDTAGQPIDNYRTWYYFVKILINIPNEKIPIDVIELIPIWLSSKFDTMLQGAEIATKLLPKFLPENQTVEDVEKAENLADYITRINWVKLPEKMRGGVLGEEEEPKTPVDPHWLLESFIKQHNAIKIGEKGSENIIYIIADRLKEILRHQRPVHWDEIELESKIYRMSVSHTRDCEFECSIGFIKEEKLKVNNAEESINKSLSSTPEDLIKFEIRDCKNIEQFKEKLKAEISKSTIANAIGDDLDNKLSHLYENIFSDYSYIWFRSISEGTGLSIHGTRETLTIILRDMLFGKAKKDESVANNIFKEFLSDKYQYPLFKRLVLFLIGECWDSFKCKFWEMLDGDGGECLFNDSDYEAEVYILLEKNVLRFSSEEKKKLQLIIQNGPQGYPPEQDKDRFISYWKQKWYSAVKTDPYFKILYEEQKANTQVEEEIHFRERNSGWGSGVSPLSKEDLLRMSNQELADFLTTFETKDTWRGPTIDGLAELLHVIAKEKPEKFIDNLTPFVNTGFIYIYQIIRGIKDAWSGKRNIDWVKLFPFLKHYVDREEFWDDKFIVKKNEWLGSANHEWIVGMLAELIEDGTRDDSWAFPQEQFREAEDIIFSILARLKADEDEAITDYVTHAINAPYGKVIIALILLALRIARVEDKKGIKKTIKWSAEYKAKYEEFLSNKIIEGYTCLGRYLPNLYYLDQEWVKEKIRNLESETRSKYWEAFMNGYLSIGKIYNELYILMRTHYQSAINYEFKEKRDSEHLIQHISLGFLRGFESIESGDSLFKQLLDYYKHEHVKEIIGFFWMQRYELTVQTEMNKDFINRIIKFWKWLYQRYADQGTLEENDKKVLSAVAKLTVFLPAIDSENFKWLMLSTPHVHLDFNSAFFIESLDTIKDKGDKIESGKYLGKIFLTTLEVFTPDYDQEHIRSIVEFLYKLNDQETIDSANRICNIYGSRGMDFLRDIYEKHRN